MEVERKDRAEKEVVVSSFNTENPSKPEKTQHLECCRKVDELCASWRIPSIAQAMQM